MSSYFALPRRYLAVCSFLFKLQDWLPFFELISHLRLALAFKIFNPQSIKHPGMRPWDLPIILRDHHKRMREWTLHHSTSTSSS
ncbi:putative transcriptional regulatory protein [Fusarium oxysporum f. sp. albedinis]|nr:putative transcriptional regulatory protein [Fusarium oxysporum f. sp. albedinis]